MPDADSNFGGSLEMKTSRATQEYICLADVQLHPRDDCQFYAKNTRQYIVTNEPTRLMKHSISPLGKNLQLPKSLNFREYYKKLCYSI